MATNDQKTPLGLSINRWGKAKADSQISIQGRQLPCVVTAVHGSIVTVAFQVTAVPGATPVTFPPATVPVVGSEYVRAPIQIGCKGMCIAAEVTLAGVSGIGGGTATTALPGNLTALAFTPLGNSGFFAVDGNTLVMYGPQGVTLMDQGQTTFVRLTPGQISLTAGGHSLVISSAGVVIDGIVFGTHVHTNGNDGGNTGGPVA